MNALKQNPPFQVVIMSEESRLGREAIETAYALKQLVQAGVRVFFYLEDRERTLDSPTDKIMLSLTAFADELEREKARQRTYDAMHGKARAGQVTGGAVFGYRNREVVGANGRRSHVERQIDDTQAAVVRRIFDLCAEGHGKVAIAKLLNAEAAPTATSAAGTSERLGAIVGARRALPRVVSRRDRVEPHEETRHVGHEAPAAAPRVRMVTCPRARAADRRRPAVGRGLMFDSPRRARPTSAPRGDDCGVARSAASPASIC